MVDFTKPAYAFDSSRGGTPYDKNIFSNPNVLHADTYGPATGSDEGDVGTGEPVTIDGLTAAQAPVHAVAMTALHPVGHGGKAPYTWTKDALPSGITLNATTGVISGTPAAAGTSATILTATDANADVGHFTINWTVS